MIDGFFLTVIVCWFIGEMIGCHDPTFKAKDWITKPEFHEDRNGSKSESKYFVQASMWLNQDE